MDDPYLLLWLEAPLQSWGADSKFGRRDTYQFPTKSGVLGLICSALGAGGEQIELLAKFADLDMAAISFLKKKSNNKIRRQEPFLRDFHMIGSGYDDHDPWQTLMIPKTSDGKKANGGTKLTYRYYLQDAIFAVLLQVPSELADNVAYAIQNPIWDIYLGRKNCIPCELIYRGLFSSKEDAAKYALELSQNRSICEYFRVLQGEHLGDEHITLNDVPLQFGTNKKYRDRIVTVMYADLDIEG